MNRSTQPTSQDQGRRRQLHLGPGEQAVQGATLMTFPIAETEDMPDIGANSFSIAFGDFGRGLSRGRPLGIRILRDPFSANHMCVLHNQRVGGGVQDFNAIKLLKFGRKPHRQIGKRGRNRDRAYANRNGRLISLKSAATESMCRIGWNCGAASAHRERDGIDFDKW